MRENTYWPDLCLIQIASSEEAAAIDPKAPGLDLKPLLDLLVENEDVLKVLHAGAQDLEIIYNLTRKTPWPMFDTQVAAMALGLASRSAIQAWSKAISAIRWTRARASPTGAAVRWKRDSWTTPFPTSPISPPCSPRC